MQASYEGGLYVVHIELMTDIIHIYVTMQYTVECINMYLSCIVLNGQVLK